MPCIDLRPPRADRVTWSIGARNCTEVLTAQNGPAADDARQQGPQALSGVDLRARSFSSSRCGNQATRGALDQASRKSCLPHLPKPFAEVKT